jgi:cell division protein FtsB
VTVISLVQSNIIDRRSSTYKEAVLQKNKAKKFLALILIFSTIVLTFLYILQVSNIASKDYEIRSLKKQKAELEDKNRDLQVNISNLKSINALQSKTEGFDMVKAQSIDYVTLPATSVVVAE